MSFITDSSFLVTGGAGFIGSNLVAHLVANNARQVRVIDNFSTGHRRNLAPFLDRIELIEGDICRREDVDRAVRGVDYVLHQAAIPSVPRSIEDPTGTTRVTVNGTLEVLHAAVRAHVRRVVVASSSSVYGDSPTLPKHEDMPLNPLSPYASSKAACELFCQSFQRVYGLESVCLRYFNVFGPRQDPLSQYAAVIPRFIAALKKGEPLPIYGDGLQTRDFTFVSNVVEANLLACTAQSAPGQRFNVGCGEQISLLDLGRALAEVMKVPLTISHLDARAGDVRYSLADISRARDVLAFNPKVGLHEGLTKTVEFFSTPGVL